MNHDRAMLLHCARVYLAQSRHFTGRARNFSFALLEWAAQCRRKIVALKKQMELFQ